MTWARVCSAAPTAPGMGVLFCTRRRSARVPLTVGGAVPLPLAKTFSPLFDANRNSGLIVAATISGAGRSLQPCGQVDHVALLQHLREDIREAIRQPEGGTRGIGNQPAASRQVRVDGHIDGLLGLAPQRSRLAPQRDGDVAHLDGML